MITISVLYCYPNINEYRYYIQGPMFDRTFDKLNDAQNDLINFLNSINYYELPDHLKILL
jgi:hypothetical protein